MALDIPTGQTIANSLAPETPSAKERKRLQQENLHLLGQDLLERSEQTVLGFAAGIPGMLGDIEKLARAAPEIFSAAKGEMKWDEAWNAYTKADPTLWTTDEYGKMIGADTDSINFMAGSVLSPTPLAGLKHGINSARYLAQGAGKVAYMAGKGVNEMATLASGGKKAALVPVGTKFSPTAQAPKSLEEWQAGMQESMKTVISTNSVNAAARKTVKMLDPRTGTEIDRLATDVATEMHQAGKTAKEIHQKTGWWMGQDGELRSIVSDMDAELKGNSFKKLLATPTSTHAKVALQDFLKHDDLFSAYNNGVFKQTFDKTLNELPVVFIKGEKPFGNGAMTSFGTIKIHLGPAKGWQAKAIDVFNKTGEKTDDFKRLEPELRQTLLHEVQHTIQSVEDMFGGGNTDNFEETFSFLRKHLLEPEKGSSLSRIHAVWNAARHTKKSFWESGDKVVDQFAELGYMKLAMASLSGIGDISLLRVLPEATKKGFYANLPGRLEGLMDNVSSLLNTGGLKPIRPHTMGSLIKQYDELLAGATGYEIRIGGKEMTRSRVMAERQFLIDTQVGSEDGGEAIIDFVTKWQSNFGVPYESKRYSRLADVMNETVPGKPYSRLEQRTKFNLYHALHGEAEAFATGENAKFIDNLIEATQKQAGTYPPGFETLSRREKVAQLDKELAGMSEKTKVEAMKAVVGELLFIGTKGKEADLRHLLGDAFPIDGKAPYTKYSNLITESSPLKDTLARIVERLESPEFALLARDGYTTKGTHTGVVVDEAMTKVVVGTLLDTMYKVDGGGLASEKLRQIFVDGVKRIVPLNRNWAEAAKTKEGCIKLGEELSKYMPTLEDDLVGSIANARKAEQIVP